MPFSRIIVPNQDNSTESAYFEFYRLEGWRDFNPIHGSLQSKTQSGILTLLQIYSATILPVTELGT